MRTDTFRRRVGRSATMLVAASFTLAGVSTPVRALAESPSRPANAVGVATPPSTIPSRYIVQFSSTRALNNMAAFERGKGTVIHDQWTHALTGFVATLSPTELQRLQNDPGVLHIEQDQVVTASTIEPNPPSWGLDRIDQRALPLTSSYSYLSNGAGVTAYVVDTGIRSTHTEFTGRVGVGFVAPGSDTGIGTEDCNGHGTHVAGTIGGTTYGVAKGVTLVPVRVLNCTGSGNESTVVAGLNWIVGNHAAGAPAVANLSLGGGISAMIDAAINSTILDGVTVVVAAGNAQPNLAPTDSCLGSPSRVPDAITVGASEINDAIASYSDWGTCVDLFAPGTSITSAWNGTDIDTLTISGTSMATPHVAGVVARILQDAPTSTPAQVWSLINAQTTAGVITGALRGSPNKLLYIAGPPGPPRSVSGVSGNAKVTVIWQAPLADGVPITDYLVEYKPAAQPTWTTFPHGVSAATSATVTGLTNNVAYVFRITAIDSIGTGPVSATSASVTPAPTVPGPPTGTTGVTGNGQVAVSWSAPADDGGSAITGYTVSAHPGPLTCTTLGGTSCTVTGLTNGSIYNFTVTATNGIGTSAASSPSPAYVPATVPGAPTGVTGVPSHSSVAVSWSAPASNGGRSISAYTVTSTPGGFTCSTASTSCVVSGLTDGTPYTFMVAATNSIGQGANSTASAPVTPAPTVPDAPTSVTAVPGNGQVAVSWAPPADNGGSPITGYAVTETGSGVICTTSSTTSCVVSGLNVGTAYTFTVVALNGIGSSATSNPSLPVTPGSGFTPLPPLRVFDTRPSELQGAVAVVKQRYGGGNVLRVKVTGAAGVPSTDVGAVSLNVTVVDPLGSGFVTVYPCGALPVVSSLNFVAGETVPNAVIAPVSGSGEVCLFSSVDAYLLADVNGWFALGSGFTTVAPARVFDTRPGELQGAVAVAKQRYGGGNVLRVKVTGAAGVPPAGVGAVSLNVTVVDPVGSGFVTVYPCGAVPVVSSLNFVAGQTVPNAVIAPVSASGEVCLFSSVDAFLVADVNGWFASGSGFTTVAPARVFDTRPSEPQGAVAVAKQLYGGANVLRVKVTGAGSVPAANVAAVSLNVTVVDPVGSGFVTVYPCGALPVVSSLNFVAGETVPNAVIAPVSASGEVCLFSSVDAYLIADVNGWFQSS